MATKIAIIAMGLVSLLGLGSAEAAPLALHRGIGVHEWLNWAPLDASGTYRQPPYYSTQEWLSGYRPLADWPGGDEFKRMKGFGFDFVRLSVDPGPILASTGKSRKVALDVLEKAVRLINRAGLKVVFNLHLNSQVQKFSPTVIEQSADAPEVAAYTAMVGDVAGMLAKIGTDQVAFEPYNEPQYYPCDKSGTDDWQRIQTAQVKAIRAVSADLTIITTGACGGDIRGLINMDAKAFDDANVLYSFHMYDPHSFTHQRLDKGWYSGLPWPASSLGQKDAEAALSEKMDAAGVGFVEQQGNWLQVGGEFAQYYADNWDEAAMAAEFKQAVDWASANGIGSERLFMGEFGVITMNEKGDTGAMPEDRDRYLKAARTLAEGYGMAWAYWEYANPYGMTFIVPKGEAVADGDLLAPLGLTANQ